MIVLVMEATRLGKFVIMKVILDTNFMMECFHYRVDLSQLFDLYPGARLATIPQVVREIKSIAGRKTTHARYAKVALGLIDGFDIIEAPDGKADEARHRAGVYSSSITRTLADFYTVIEMIPWERE